MNECKLVEDLIPLYAEDLTSEETAQFVKNHVSQCENCRKLLENCGVSQPTPEENAKAYKKALRKNQFNLICKATLACILSLLIGTSALEKLSNHFAWMEGKAPVEQVVTAPVGKGEVTLVDWEASGYSIGGTENTGTLIWFEMRDAWENEYGTSYSWNEGGYSQAWENVQIYWAPNGKPFLVTADLPEGGEGIFVHHYKSWYDEKGKHFSESRFLPNTRGNGLVDVLTELCKEQKDFPTGWETIEFTFHQWQEDCETITFVYETDTGIRGLLDYHYPTEAITKVN